MSPSSSTFKVCRDHFTHNDFEGPTTLRPDAVPSLFTTHSRTLMNKQNTNDPSASSTPTSSAKRFRPDMASIRAKQTTPMNSTSINNKRAPVPYRTNINNNNLYQRQHMASSSSVHHPYNNEQQQQQQQQQYRVPSPPNDSIDDNAKHLMNEAKQSIDIDLNMNCMEDGLSEVQVAHSPVKVSSSTCTRVIFIIHAP